MGGEVDILAPGPAYPQYVGLFVSNQSTYVGRTRPGGCLIQNPDQPAYTNQDGYSQLTRLTCLRQNQVRHRGQMCRIYCMVRVYWIGPLGDPDGWVYVAILVPILDGFWINPYQDVSGNGQTLPLSGCSITTHLD